MFDHVSLRVSDLPFAVGALGTGLRELGIERTADTLSSARWGNFVLMQDNDERPPTRRVHVAFIAKAQADVDRFWQAGVDASLVDDGPAGPRPHYADDYYAGFLKDAAGNSFEVVYRDRRSTSRRHRSHRHPGQRSGGVNPVLRDGGSGRRTDDPRPNG
jgi:hypothetical protein